MKGLFKIFICVLLSQFSNAQVQEFQGMAVYELKLVEATEPKIDGNGQNENKNKAIIESMKVLSKRKRTFELKFNKIESVYQEEEQLDLPSAPAKGMVIKLVSTGFGKTYKNLVKKEEIVERDLLSKEFLVTEPLKEIDWILDSETKKIGDFTCFKATATFPVSDIDQREDNSILSATTAREPKKITVWYTPEIPVNHGPEDLWGLPGLILEVNDGKIITLCSKVVMNTKDKMKIEVPTKGIVITQNAYDALERQKMQEIKDRN